MKKHEWVNIIREKGLMEKTHQIDLLMYEKKTNLPLVIAASPSAGKTEYVLLKLEHFFRNTQNKNKKVLIIPASKTVLRDNFAGRISGFLNPSFSTKVIKYNIDEDKAEERTSMEVKNDIKEAFSGEYQVIVSLPQILRDNIDLSSEVDMIIIDEAHQWYFAENKEGEGTMKIIIKKTKPKEQILLTGTPFIFNLHKEKFEMYYIAPSDLYKIGEINNVQIEVISSPIDFKNYDYNGTYGDIKRDLNISKDITELSLKSVCEDMIKKLKSPLRKKLQTIKNLTDHIPGGFIGDLFNLLDKTIIYCYSTDQADVFYNILNSKEKLKGRVLISHSKIDKGSEELRVFKEQKEHKILIVVDRAREGYDHPDLFNIVDFSYTQNITVLNQMFPRLFRFPRDKKRRKDQKIFFKVSPKNSVSYFRDLMTTCLAVCEREWFMKYNTKNMGDLPVFKRRRKRYGIKNTITKNQENTKKFIKEKDLESLGVPLNLNLWTDHKHSDEDNFSTIYQTTLDEARRAFVGYGESLDSMEPRVLEIYHNGEELSDPQIAEKCGIHSVSVGLIRERNGLKSWEKIKYERLRKDVIDLYWNGEKPSTTEISKRLGCGSNTVCQILAENKLPFWANVKMKEVEEFIIEKIKSNPNIGLTEIAKHINNQWNYSSLQSAISTVSKILLKNEISISDRNTVEKNKTINKILNLHTKGWSNKEIAEKIGISGSGVGQILKEKGKTPNISRLKKKSEENREKVIKRYEMGDMPSNAKIAKDCSITEPSVCLILKKEGKKPWIVATRKTKVL
jgi:DNA-directed RNA polymerase specialized sigma subunit